ncbi:MAG TPA: hypothetical protein VEX62_00535 [Candidatus Limnocylindrales bacterium]|nr:hypothetical protein [Candidatus Limnocylindrales bacterium]
MNRSPLPSRISTGWLPRSLVALQAALILIAALAPAALAQDPSASPSPSALPASELSIVARPLLGGNVRPGAWTAVDVQVTNDGPAVNGELRIRGQQEGRSQYGVEVQLPPGAVQRFTLYAQTALFGSRIFVDLANGEQIVATQQVNIRSHDAYSPIVAVVAERPERVLPQVTGAMVNPNVSTTTVIQLAPADLPPRVEAWAAIDRLVWQDVDAAQLSPAQLEALKLWIGAGGRLTILGGTTGAGTLRGFGNDLLPFDPQTTVEAAPADVAAMLGSLPSDAVAVPALSGTLNRGSVLARSGEAVIAAESGYGRGVITLIGFDPAASWITDSSASDVLWRRLLPQTSGPALNPMTLPDDSQIVYALQNLPSIDLPPIEQLFILLVAYIVLIGPINYLILRKLDKREWAWVTIPALVAVFALGSYGLGATLKGSDVIVNEIAVVRAAQGTGRGIGQVYVGIYSPSRRTFDVRIPGGALISNPTSLAQTGQTETPLDVLFGESTSRLRNFEVGFGVLRGFRAEAPADAPEVESDLRFVSGKLQGSITNRSDRVLENVAVLFGGGVAVLPAPGLQPGETREIDLDTTGSNMFGYALSERIFGTTFPRDASAARAVYTRRTVIDQLFPYGSTPSADAPLLLAWSNGPVMDVELAGDGTPNRVGEGLFMIPLAVRLDAQQVFSDGVMRRSIVESTAAQGWGDQSGYYLSRGTMSIEAAPARFDGSFRATALEIALTQGEVRPLRGNGDPLAPLPEADQPDQEDPVGTESTDPTASPPVLGGGGSDDGDDPKPAEPLPDPIGRDAQTLPAVQLYDYTTQRWVEFEQPLTTSSYLIASPERYVNSSGGVLFRFVNRNATDEFGMEQTYFQLLMRVEGAIE